MATGSASSRSRKTVVLVDDDVEFLGDADEGSSKEVCHECPTCGKVFRNAWHLTQHERAHSGERPFQCLVCGRSFAQKSNANKHVRTHRVWPKSVMKAPEWHPDSGAGGADNDEDDDVLPPPHLRYDCSFCPHSSTFYGAFRRHIRENHEDEKRFQCSVSDCGGYFVSVLDLLAHRSEAHSSTRFYACLERRGCQARFASVEDLAIHHRAHKLRQDPEGSSGEAKGDHRCTDCSSAFATAKGLHNHRLRGCGDQMGKPEFVCPICKETKRSTRAFASDVALRKHFRDAHRSARFDPSFCCQVCGRDFASATGLKSHVAIHTGEAGFICPVCRKSFNRKDKLKRHSVIHSDRRFPCPFAKSLGCEVTFTRRDKAKEHAAVHGGFKAKCGDCEEVFTSRADLAYHRRRVHPRKKRLQCLRCNKKFHLETQRQKHHQEKHGLVYQFSNQVQELDKRLGTPSLEKSAGEPHDAHLASGAGPSNDEEEEEEGEDIVTSVLIYEESQC